VMAQSGCLEKGQDDLTKVQDVLVMDQLMQYVELETPGLMLHQVKCEN